MQDIPYPRLAGLAAAIIALLFVWGVAQVVFHEPDGPPRQVYVFE